MSLLVIEVWQWTPLVTLVVLARLAALPGRLRECAALDGLSRWQTLSWVILPQLKRVVVIVAVLRTIDSFRVFETVWALYGDLENTATLSVRVFREALLVRDYGDGAAMGILLFLLSILTCGLVLLYAARPSSISSWIRRSRV